jgi:hypothetical protein
MQKRAFQSGFGWHRAGCSVASVRSEDPAVWRDLELGAPRLARLGMARLDAARVALLGTLRRDGSPRISPIEPCLADGQLLIGAMAWSQKTADLRRDPRYVLHSAVTGPDSGEGELKPRSFASQQQKRGGRAGQPTGRSCSHCTLIRRYSSAGTPGKA